MQMIFKCIIVIGYISFVSVSVCDENFKNTQRDSELPDGKYRISINVKGQGKFIESKDDCETRLYGCIYTLIKKAK